MEDQKDEDSESQQDWSGYGHDGVDVFSLHRRCDRSAPQFRRGRVVRVSIGSWSLRSFEVVHRMGPKELEGVFLIPLQLSYP